MQPLDAFFWYAQAATPHIRPLVAGLFGPQQQRYLAGAKIDTVFPFAPVLLGIPLSIALVSYGDTCGIGIDADPAAIPDPELLAQFLREEFQRVGSFVRSRRRRGVEELRATYPPHLVGHNGGGARVHEPAHVAAQPH